jgi:hypothetical protein
VVAASDAWLSPAERGSCATVSLADHHAVTLGLDGLVREDSTALVACRISAMAAVPAYEAGADAVSLGLYRQRRARRARQTALAVRPDCICHGARFTWCQTAAGA